MSKRFLDIVDLSLSDEEVADRLRYAIEQVKADEETGEVNLKPEDVAVLQQCLREGGSKTRNVAASYISWHGPICWNDVELIAFDPDWDVRYEVVGYLDSEWRAASRLCLSGKARCVQLVADVAVKYPDEYQSATILKELSYRDDEWLDLTWKAINDLVEIDDPDINTKVLVCYLEHVVIDRNWGPDDSHINSWVYGDDCAKQGFLLMIAAQEELDKGKLRDIIQALTNSKHIRIRTSAKDVIEGRVLQAFTRWKQADQLSDTDN